MSVDVTPAIDLEDVHFAWPGGGFELAVPAFRLERGERCLLVGPSGAGKSTLLSLICGIAVPGSGTVRVLGEALEKLSGGRRDRFRAEHFGIVFQLFNLLPYATPLDNVLLPLGFAPKRKARLGSDAAAEARRLMAALDLPESVVGQSASATLSVGQQQRAAAARALIGDPEIVVADEPTSALDNDTQERFLDLLFARIEASGATLLTVSHDVGLGAAIRHRHRPRRSR